MPPSPTVNYSGEPVLSLNHGYKQYKYDTPNDFLTNERVHAKQWRIRRPSSNIISDNGAVTREFFPLD